MVSQITDIHFHPTLKPFGNSLTPGTKTDDVNSIGCIWHSDPPDADDELAENILGFAAYRESDFSTLVSGNVSVGVVALYPVETGFVHPEIFKPEAKELIEMVTLLGNDCIDFLRSSSYNYFEYLKREYNYLLSLDGKIPIQGSQKYVMVRSGSDLIAKNNESLKIIVSIEGAHVFCEGKDVKNDVAWKNLEANVKEVKAWKYPPFFITFCHHFYNSLASHARSLFIDVLGKNLLNQSDGMDHPLENGKYITQRGYQLIDLLYTTDNGKRILIDIKHMAKETRKEFYVYHRTKYPSVPIIFSHGATTTFYNQNINLDSDDIKEIFLSKGLIGIELDQRILGYNDQHKDNRFWNWLLDIFRSSAKKDFLWAEYYWKNILLIAEACYELNPNDDPWKIICVGSDLDGIINPLNRFRRSDKLQNLAASLLKYLNQYWASGKNKIPIIHKGTPAPDVIDHIFHKNAYDFIVNNY